MDRGSSAFPVVPCKFLGLERGKGLVGFVKWGKSPYKRQRGAPHDVLLVVVVALVLVVSSLIGDQGEAITELLSPVDLLLLRIVLFLTIQFLSSKRGSFISSMFLTGKPNTIHKVSDCTVGVMLILIIILFLLYNLVSIFDDGDDFDE
ncbi:hypothetical protein F2P56_015476 [Juglans regia]|uniref:Uncharacterized protein n=1 Tax=Juglans regia TaxID=51240 RepID=A0A834CV08_JUGRE|nr:hypothetical protein F2P56_015476 [Juglans regia]